MLTQIIVAYLIRSVNNSRLKTFYKPVHYVDGCQKLESYLKALGHPSSSNKGKVCKSTLEIHYNETIFHTYVHKKNPSNFWTIDDPRFLNDCRP